LETILYNVSDDVAQLTLNRPDVLNRINTKMIEEVRATVATFAADETARVLLITGNGKGFCADADLAANVAGGDYMTTGQRVAHGMDVGFNPLVRELAEVPKPVITAVNGTTAGGGCGLILECVDDEALMEHALKYARKLADGPPKAFREIKKALDISERHTLSEQLDYEHDTQGILGDHANSKEGVVSFLKKKTPSSWHNPKQTTSNIYPKCTTGENYGI